ncbi:hypothetical protein ACFXPW_24150 [Streptomyces goshikiensis]
MRAANNYAPPRPPPPLVQRTEKNTTAMLENLLRSLGFREVTVSYG